MLRLVLTPRWVGWTLLAALIVVVCFGMAYWQLLRAESSSGSLLNAGYALQWPLFAVFFGFLWWRMLRLEARTVEDLERAHEALPAGGDDRSRDDGSWAAAAEAVAAARTPSALLAPAASSPLAGPSPFTPRPAGVRPGDADAPPAPGSGRAEYNAMLADLARRHADRDGPDQQDRPDQQNGARP